jgi:hypothetical protein
VISARPLELPAILDIEASGFGAGSYPIEVGYYLPDGRMYCALIHPEPGWTHWDASAEAVHGVSRPILLEKGRPPQEVASRLNADLRGLNVYCDAWAHDFPWLHKLYDAADMVPAFALKDLRQLLGDCEQTVWHKTRAAVELRLQLRRHRASGDARTLFETLSESRKRCAPDWSN